MSTSNPIPGVGGTNQEGGISTAATVADGGPDRNQPQDSQYLPPGGQSREKPYTESSDNVATFNPAPGVGGTARDGGLSTAATVADGGPNDPAKDPSYKP